jgi:hypothetical protein
LQPLPEVVITTKKGKTEEVQNLPLETLVEVRGWKALGVKLSQTGIKAVTFRSVRPADA